MDLLIKILIIIIAIEHLYFLWLEMFAWTTRARKVFTMLPQDLFEPTKAMAANQGLYNGFLAAGLIWSILIGNAEWAVHVATFFLCCVLTAGLYGWYSADKRIFFVQGIPALLALVILHFL